MREALRSGKEEEVQAEQEIASSGPCPGSPQDKGRAVRGNVILFGQAKKTLIRAQKAKEHRLSPGAALWRLLTLGREARRPSSARLLGTALISVIHQVVPREARTQSSSGMETLTLVLFSEILSASQAGLELAIELRPILKSQFSSFPRARTTAVSHQAQLCSLPHERRAKGFCA